MQICRGGRGRANAALVSPRPPCLGSPPSSGVLSCPSSCPHLCSPCLPPEYRFHESATSVPAEGPLHRLDSEFRWRRVWRCAPTSPAIRFARADRVAARPRQLLLLLCIISFFLIVCFKQHIINTITTTITITNYYYYYYYHYYSYDYSYVRHGPTRGRRRGRAAARPAAAGPRHLRGRRRSRSARGERVLGAHVLRRRLAPAWRSFSRGHSLL